MDQIADTKPGSYYVSAIDGTKHFLMSGPYAGHQQALDDVRKVEEFCSEKNPRGAFMAWGTCRIEGSARLGNLQKLGMWSIAA